MQKYQAFNTVALADRTWPDQAITTAPLWCSVDLRDGNQALVNPMGVDQKLAMFDLLVKLGFKQIEVGFPSASQIEFDFCRRLIDEHRIPSDVTIQILCQAREHLIEKSFEALAGAENVIFHLYNSTSPAQRDYTFGMSRDQIKDMAVDGVAMIRRHQNLLGGGRLTLEYSPESYSHTEDDFALEICEAVKTAWGPTAQHPMIINLPSTVENSLPNQFADRIEWFARNASGRDTYLLSLHPHNDRGTGVATAEMGLLAGAQRIEGTLFGNGERTGNLDLVTIALNMLSHGVDPELDFSDLPSIVNAYQELTGMEVHPRHPYAGELVFTAFSGSHQDAIKKALEKREERQKAARSAGTDPATVAWDVPYIPVDPTDIGRSYEAIIRINSQSGKGGVAWILKQNYGIDLPRAMHPEVGALVNLHADKSGTELSGETIYHIFSDEYLDRTGTLSLLSFQGESIDSANGKTSCNARVRIGSTDKEIHGQGNGPVEAFVDGLAKVGFNGFEILDFHEDAMGSGVESKAAACIRVRLAKATKDFWGVGLDRSITLAGLKALISAINRAHA